MNSNLAPSDLWMISCLWTNQSQAHVHLLTNERQGQVKVD